MENQSQPDGYLVQPFGSSSSFEIATWNIEQFPKSGQNTVTTLTRLIKNFDIDLIAFQEINSQEYFKCLLDSLPQYEGFCSLYPEDNMKLGLVYKQDMISISNITQLFINDTYNFPRPPLYAYIRIKFNDVVAFDFSLINLHLKAYHDTTSIMKRKHAITALKEVIDTRLFTSRDHDIIILGDWNDELSDNEKENIFLPFLQDSLNYSFLIPEGDVQISYPAWQSRIDHILISNDVKFEYKNGTIQILQPDKEFEDYFNIISDHRPLAAKFYIFEER